MRANLMKMLGFMPPKLLFNLLDPSENTYYSEDAGTVLRDGGDRGYGEHVFKCCLLPERSNVLWSASVRRATTASRPRRSPEFSPAAADQEHGDQWPSGPDADHPNALFQINGVHGPDID
ncbi:unnamed protein product [Pleuronectes platessa]|uniref:Uncharacterized protein n=1 Tax=Pleuronectes platessa TaxID=8262 RepID=A0A9N7TRF4_PLEPL|nr:unnamed protein product [Pleuronectes platessa]